ncbi:uncharacterized protein F5Z01DRAFT_426443 [Emericellopsis atlantica]|uniref:Homeobox domain-containing protein n=1 Tax=Emericellopsis atlantica TaxID=2614577 RepID=A0A9P7ZE59_9HYPO|nr:uncharacterized protein F5Z01DRAFT_426443 [Emericellopsis atlantica]KAG9250071.1 hypothetical protein F5Z01DRAFT_426443 [Emericellopsis atlantica]
MLTSRVRDVQPSGSGFHSFIESCAAPGHPRMSNPFNVSPSTHTDWVGTSPYSLQHGSSTTGALTKPEPDQNYDSRAQSPVSTCKDDEVESSMHANRFSEAQVPQSLNEATSAHTLRQNMPQEYSVDRDIVQQHGNTDFVHGDGINSTSPGHGSIRHEDSFVDFKAEDEDEGMEDDEDGCAEPLDRPMTAAERSAARRKMKRFRLTHQQTRFLMNEFIKQPHPDAAHRERLSREIPGLSPRQVQVWFQNRRAKIKRLSAEDRDRVIKMRAVPEGFNSAQALHSPYGAVPGLAPNLTPTSMSGQQTGSHLNRPLMVDVQRPQADTNTSPTGLTPAFDTTGFRASSSTNDDLVSPLSSSSAERGQAHSIQYPPRFGSASHSTGPLSAGALHSTYQLGQYGSRSLHPLNLQDLSSRSRVDSLQSPSRSNLAWQDNPLQYPEWKVGAHEGSTSERQHAQYSVGGDAQSSEHYANDNYSARAFAMNNNMAYAPKDMVSSDRPRLRATSATFPLNLDLEDQYRPQGSQSRASDRLSVSLSDPSTQYTNPNIYTTSYPPAPLTAPLSSTYSRANDAKSHLAGPPPRAGTASSSRATEYLLAPHSKPGNAEPHQDPRHPLSHQTHAGRPNVFPGENRSSEYTSRP